MDFAKKQLEKYGWREGKGLGKQEDGISTAIRPKLKFDNAGVGHDVGEQFTNNWWEKVFNSAAQNIDVNVENDEVKMKIKSEDAVEITTKSYSLKKLKKQKYVKYGLFVKTSRMIGNCVESLNDEDNEPAETPSKCFQIVSDEDILAACEGRTAHKGARHGLKLSGKLSRLEKQERLLLKKMKRVSLSDDKSNVEKKLKKLKKQKTGKELPEIVVDQQPSVSPLKRKSSKKKSVTFNETTMTKYYPADTDTSFDSELSSLKDENSNEPIVLENTPNGCDEGIEQDLENNNEDFQDNHRSFEEAQFKYNDLSKSERKKLKKKRKLEAKRHRSTEKFLKQADGNSATLDEMMPDWDDKDVNLKKRKFNFEESEDSKCKRSQTEMEDSNKSKRNKRKRKKQMKLEQKQMNSIVKSLDSFCRISDDE